MNTTNINDTVSPVELDTALVRSAVLDAAHIGDINGAAGLALRRLDSNDLEETGRVVVNALMTASHRVDADVERIVGRLSLEPTVSAARWQAEIHFNAEGRQSPSAVMHSDRQHAR